MISSLTPTSVHGSSLWGFILERSGVHIQGIAGHPYSTPHPDRSENYRKILPFWWRSIEKIYPSTIIFAFPRLYQKYWLGEIDKISDFPSEKCLKYLRVHCYFYLSWAVSNYHPCWSRVAAVWTRNTLIRYTANFRVDIVVPQLQYTCTLNTPAYCSVFSVCIEDFKHSTFSAPLQVPWNYTDPALHFNGGW